MATFYTSNRTRWSWHLIGSKCVVSSIASSLTATRHLVGHILKDAFLSCLTSEADSVANCWTALGHEPITTDKKPFKRYWSTTVREALFRVPKAGASPSHLALIMTADQGHSGDWITACKIAHFGTRSKNEALRIGVALLLRLDIYLAHQCRCRSTANSDSLHQLSCRFSAGRFPWHAAINNVIKRSLESVCLHHNNNNGQF